jgi:hypothetical protein
MRVPDPHGGKVSAVLVPRPMGFLAVRLLMDGYRVIGVPVSFFCCEGDGEKGDAIGDPIRSDDQGVARLPRLVPTGTYLCEIEGQETSAIVTTVNRLEEAALLPLPLGSESVASHWNNDEPDGSETDDDDSKESA